MFFHGLIHFKTYPHYEREYIDNLKRVKMIWKILLDDTFHYRYTLWCFISYIQSSLWRTEPKWLWIFLFVLTKGKYSRSYLDNSKLHHEDLLYYLSLGFSEVLKGMWAGNITLHRVLVINQRREVFLFNGDANMLIYFCVRPLNSLLLDMYCYPKVLIQIKIKET